MKFESLRHQISHFVHEAREPLTFAQLREICDMAVDDKQLVNAVYSMSKAGELTKHKAPQGSGMGAKFTYGPGKKKPGAEAPDDVQPAPPLRRRSKAVGKNPVRRKAIKRRRRRQAATPRPTGGMWALTEAGTFVLLSAPPIHVERKVVHVIVDLVRAGADLAALAAFIGQLDQGQV